MDFALIQLALIIGLFWAALAHPQRIHNVMTFQFAIWVLALSIVMPVLLSSIWTARHMPGGPTLPHESRVLLSFVPSALVALSLLLGLYSVLPSRDSN